jgi:hypothetical protein
MTAGRLIAATAAISAVMGAGCGSDAETTSTAPEPAGANSASVTAPAAKLPQGAVGPVDGDEGGGAAEASPESPAEGPETGSLDQVDEEAVANSVRDYIDALDRHDAAEVCSLLATGALDLRQLPVKRGGCKGSLSASIGRRPSDGGPAWRKTEIYAVKAVSVEGGGARVTATVTHRFSDRKYVSVEDDVIYLEKAGGVWLLAKPSGTFYRAVGYPEPPLSAFEPPG